MLMCKSSNKYGKYILVLVVVKFNLQDLLDVCKCLDLFDNCKIEEVKMICMVVLVCVFNLVFVNYVCGLIVMQEGQFV